MKMQTDYDKLHAEYTALAARLAEAQELNMGWFKANGPGGWIDNNRNRLAEVTIQLDAERHGHAQCHKELRAAEARLAERELDWLNQQEQIKDQQEQLGEAKRLLREAREEVEWWTPCESAAATEERPRLNRWFAKRDRIDAFLGATASASTEDKWTTSHPGADVRCAGLPTI